MKQLLQALAIGILSSATLLAQVSKKLQVSDFETGRSIGNATLSIQGPVRLRVHTDAEGFVQLSKLPKGSYTMTIFADGYEAKQVVFSVEREGVAPVLPELKLSALADLRLMDDELEAVAEDGTEMGSIMQSSLLTSSRNSFLSAAGYTFSVARFNRRGYDSPYRMQYLNGVPMNDLNSGYGVWSLWNGLNDVTRNQTNGDSFEPLESGFGSIGMSNNLSIRASKMRSQKRVTYSNSNRTYTNRAMVHWATGELPSGWSLGLVLSRRFGNGMHSYARGVHYDAWAYMLALEKRFDQYNSLGLIAFAAPTKRGVASGSTQEAYDLVGSNYYNPNMGRQGGKWRNAREKSNHEPVIQLTHYFKTPNEKFKLNTSFSYRFGYNTYSALNWYNAPDPRADYYRNLPSYFTDLAREGQADPETAGLYQELWKTDPNTRYINWDQLYKINRQNSAPLYNSEGKLLANGNRALYMIDLRHTDQKEFSGASNLNWEAKDWLRVMGGLNYRHNVTHYFNEVGDLLGANYVYDIDKFAERDFGGTPDKFQMDLNNPDHIAVEGDKFGNNYKASTQRYQAWLNFKYKFSHLDAYTAFSLTQTNVYRNGLQRRGLFPENSFGKSDELRFMDFGAKLGLTYKINGRHYLVLNAGYVEQAPHFRNIFVSPRTRNTAVEGIESEKLMSVDLSYAVRLPWLRGLVTVFASQIKDKSKTMSFYDDAASAFSNYSLTGIATRHFGTELGFEAKLSPTLSLNTAFALGQYQYDNNPNFIQTIDNSEKIIAQDKVYWKGLEVSGTPQTAASVGMTYRAPWYGMFGFNANYFGRSYISMNPTLRTELARQTFDKTVINPEELKGGFTLDLFLGYSYRITHGKYIRFNLSINNLLNNRNLHSGGYEQLRVRTQDADDGSKQLYKPFPSKYFYAYGTTYFFNTSFQF